MREGKGRRVINAGPRDEDGRGAARQGGTGGAVTNVEVFSHNVSYSEVAP